MFYLKCQQKHFEIASINFHMAKVHFKDKRVPPKKKKSQHK